MKFPITPVYSAKNFSWKGNSGTTFASDLGCTCGKVPGAQIYDDACDYGFHVEGNDRTILFVLSENMYHNGELCGWKYVSASNELGKFDLTIFND